MHSKNVHRRKSAAAKTLFDLKKSKSTYTYPSFKTDQHEDSMSDIACDYKHRPSNPTSVPPPEAAPTSTPFKDPYFPHIEQNDFQILDTKNINASLTLAYCGVRRGNSSRLWSLCLGTPQCLIEKLYARNDQGTTNDRFLLTPDFYNDVLGSDFNAFLDHMEGCSERIKLKFLEAGHDVSKWKSPVRSNRGVVQGLQVKVRMQILSDRMYALAGRPIQAVVKLSCVYFTPDRSGLSYEIIDLYSLQGEPKQEWVQTTIDSIVNSDVHSDMETVVT